MWLRAVSDRTGTNGNGSKDGKLGLPADSRLARQVSRRARRSRAANCNQKLIGAQYFNAAWGGDAGIDAQRRGSSLSPRDYNGHGTHTSSTAGGNNGVHATGAAAGVRQDQRHRAAGAHRHVQGAAGRPRTDPPRSGFTSDLVAAIDQAVADGVDVINYSISGTLDELPRPGRGRVPLRRRRRRVRRGLGRQQRPDRRRRSRTRARGSPPSPPARTTATASAPSRSATAPPTTARRSAAASRPAPLDRLRRRAGLPAPIRRGRSCCYAAPTTTAPSVLDPAKVAGQDRRLRARRQRPRRQEPRRAGGRRRRHDPRQHVAELAQRRLPLRADRAPRTTTERAALKAYAATAGATATINAGDDHRTTRRRRSRPSFSSRGPLAAGGGDLLKPDVIAPGQDILAAVAPPGNARP